MYFLGADLMKKMLTLIRKTCIAFLMLYGFNVIMNSFEVYIPINMVTTGAVSALGIPGIVSLVAVFLIVK